MPPVGWGSIPVLYSSVFQTYNPETLPIPAPYSNVFQTFYTSLAFPKPCLFQPYIPMYSISCYLHQHCIPEVLPIPATYSIAFQTLLPIPASYSRSFVHSGPVFQCIPDLVIYSSTVFLKPWLTHPCIPKALTIPVLYSNVFQTLSIPAP